MCVKWLKCKKSAWSGDINDDPTLQETILETHGMDLAERGQGCGKQPEQGWAYGVEQEKGTWWVGVFGV